MGDITVTNRAISQANLFWHHKFCSGADSYLYPGDSRSRPARRRRQLARLDARRQRAGALEPKLGPLRQRRLLHPSASAGPTAAIESGYDISMGIAWYIGSGARSHAINGHCADPYMPVANNNNFLVEQNHPY